MFPLCVHSHKILPLSLEETLHYSLESHVGGLVSFLPQHDLCLCLGLTLGCWELVASPILTSFAFLPRNWICLPSHCGISEYLLHHHPVLGALLPVQLLHFSATMGQLQ